MKKLQRYEEKSRRIRKEFLRRKKEHPELFERRIDLSFCTLMFGLEDVADSVARLAKKGYRYIEVLGNCAGDTSGNSAQTREIKEALDHYGMKCSGVCMLIQSGFCLESRDFFVKQRSHDFIKRNVAFCHELGGSYCLVTLGGTDGIKPAPDGGDWARSVRALREIAFIFEEYGVKCAIEPILKSITPIVHSFEDAKKYIAEVDHPSVAYIYGDTEHMMASEEHIGEAILDAGSQLLNLHIKDTNEQRPVGRGMMDLDTIIRALYLIGFNQAGHFVVGEPLPDYYDPVPGYGTLIPHGGEVLDLLAGETIDYFREREENVLGEE